MTLVFFIGRWWALFALAAAAAMLGAAHYIEAVEGLRPCELCLKQRDALWAVVGVALPASVWALLIGSKGTSRLAAYLIFAAFAAGAIVAGYHAGVEAKLWRGPQSCTGGGTVSFEDIQALVRGVKIRAPQCDVVVWRFLNLSMSTWNAMICGSFAIASLLSSARRKDPRG